MLAHFVSLSLFLLPNPQHTSTTEAELQFHWSAPSARDIHTAPFTTFCFRWDPNSAPPSVGFYFDIFFCFFHVPPFFVLCLLRLWLTWLWMLVYLCLFFYSLLKYSIYASSFLFLFFILKVSLSCSFVTAMVLWTMSALLCCWLGKKKIICTETLPKHRHRFLEV